jgi:DnaK suppressor protein
MSRPTIPAARGTSGLSAGQLAALRAMLEQQRRFRLDQLAQLHRADQLGRLSGSDAEISQSLLAGARAALRDVAQALQRMDEGRYGRCRQCSARLPVERLEILPQVALCMSCQRQAEAG